MTTISEEQERHKKALALIICLFIGFLYVETVWKPYFYGVPNPQGNAVSRPETPAAQTHTQQSSPEQFVETLPGAPAKTASIPAVPAVPAITTTAAQPPAANLAVYPSDAEVRDAGIVSVATPNLATDISLLGGRVTSLLLLGYPKASDQPKEHFDMVRHVEQAPLPLGVYSGAVNDARTLYQLADDAGSSSGLKDGRTSYSLNPSDAKKSLTLKGQLPDGRGISKTFTFYPAGYAVDVQVQLSEPAPDSSRLSLEWSKFADESETSILDPYNVQGYVWFDGQKAHREAFAKLEADHVPVGDVHWLAMADKYFHATLLSRDKIAAASLVKTGRLFRSRLSGDAQTAAVSLIVGPKSYEYLESVGQELVRIIDFGKFGVISGPLLSMLHLLYGILGNYGLAIVVLTITVKMCLYPLNSASFKQMKAMQDLKPDIDRIRETVKDKQQQQLELMAMYKKRGVNPLGGCLPVLLQMPIFIGLYSSLMLAVELRGAHFAMWIHDLSAPEKLMIAGHGIPVMVILFVISMMVQQWTTPSSMDPTQKKVMMGMPLVMGFMFCNFPAGLTLYWLTNNLISIGQQKALHHSKNGGNAFAITAMVSTAVFSLAFLVSRF